MLIHRYSEAAGAAMSALACDDCIARLERESEKRFNTDCVALCSVDAALHTALHLCGVTNGDYVFVPSYTFYSYINSVGHVGGVPVFLDCDPVTRCVSAQALDAALLWSELQNKPPKAVVVDNAFGSVADYDVLSPLCAAYGVPLIELAIDAFHGRYKGTPCGANGVYGIIGFDKAAPGGGGVLVCGDDKRKAQGFARISYSSGESYDYKMNNFIAALDLSQLAVSDKIYKRCKANLAALVALTEAVVRPVDGDSCAYALIKPVCGVDELKHYGFTVKKPPPVHRLDRYDDCCYFEHEPGYSVCDSFSDHCLVSMDISAVKRLQLIKKIRII